MKRLLLLLAAFSVSVFADISGTWKGTAETQNGNFERTFVFKVEGSKLTGETTSPRLGKSTIADGKIEGDDVSFTILVKFQDNEMKLTYKGKVSGDSIKFDVIGPDGDTLAQYNAKRVS